MHLQRNAMLLVPPAWSEAGRGPGGHVSTQQHSGCTGWRALRWADSQQQTFLQSSVSSLATCKAVLWLQKNPAEKPYQLYNSKRVPLAMGSFKSLPALLYLVKVYNPSSFVVSLSLTVVASSKVTSFTSKYFWMYRSASNSALNEQPGKTRACKTSTVATWLSQWCSHMFRMSNQTCAIISHAAFSVATQEAVSSFGISSLVPPSSASVWISSTASSSSDRATLEISRRC